jgi:hypothetical protein
MVMREKNKVEAKDLGIFESEPIVSLRQHAGKPPFDVVPKAKRAIRAGGRIRRANYQRLTAAGKLGKAGAEARCALKGVLERLNAASAANRMPEAP